MGAWGYYQYPTQPPGIDYDRLDDEREDEWDARPTYEELMYQYDNAVEEELCP